jgi:hypothetical protein
MEAGENLRDPPRLYDLILPTLAVVEEHQSDQRQFDIWGSEYGCSFRLYR